MKHYPRQDWLFGEGTGPSSTPGIWLAKSNQPESPFEIDFSDSELDQFVDNDDLMSFVIYFRKLKKNAMNKILQLLQKNQIEESTKNPELLMESPDSEKYLDSTQKYETAMGWLPIVEEAARKRGLIEELNSNVV